MDRLDLYGQHDRHGQHNRVLLVLCDSRQEDTYLDVEPAFIAALNHWGMPYHLHDLAGGPPSAEMLDGYAALLLAQQNLGSALSEDTSQRLAEAVAGGLGYIGADGGIEHMPLPLQHMLAVRVQDVQPAMGTQVVDDGHFVSKWQEQGDCYRFKRPLEMAHVAPTMPRVRVLLESEGHPAMWVTQYGHGRVIQWALAPALWQRKVLGHGEGLDDLLWRGIVWAARKPFAMLAMPPFSTAVVGDAIGSHDFAWIEALNRHGFPPNVGIFPDDIDTLSEIKGQSNFFDRAVDAMRRYAGSNMAEFSPHAATWNRAYLLYSRADGNEIPTNELAQRLAAVDKQFARYGIPWARTIHPHYDQLEYNALPFLQNRGIEFTLSGQLPGEAWDGEHKLWGGDPFNHPGFTIAPLPQAPDFYVVTSGCSHHETTVLTGLDTYRLRGHAYQMETNIMWGRTRWKDQCQVNDWDAIVCAAVRQIRLGLNALFFARPMTSEQTIAFITLDEWESLWGEIERRTARYERWPALYSDVAAYARARHRTRMVNAHFDGTLLTNELEGSPDIPLYLYIWSDFGDSEWVVHRYEKVPPFKRTKRIVVTGQ